MSWSVYGMGRARGLAKKIEDDLARMRCREPEETIKANVAVAIGAALRAMPAETVVRVEASGSQMGDGQGDTVNSLSVKIEPIYGFVE